MQTKTVELDKLEEIGIQPEPKGSGRGSPHAPAMQKKKEISRKQPPTVTFTATAIPSFPEPMERINTLQMPESVTIHAPSFEKMEEPTLFLEDEEPSLFPEEPAPPPPVKCKS